MRPIKILAACSLIMMSVFAGEAYAQRGGGGGGGGNNGGGGGGMQGGGFPSGGMPQNTSSNRSRVDRESELDPQQGAQAEAAEIRARIQSRTYTFKETGQKLPYSVLLPRKFKKDKPMPLVIALHSLNAEPDSIVAALGAAADRHGYILVAPMGYKLDGWYGYGQYVKGLADPEVSRLSELDVTNVLDIARVEFKIDSKRIYVVGHSMGGTGAVYLAAKYPDTFAAVGALSPVFTNEVPEEVAEFDQTPVVVAHGEKDEVVPVALVRAWVDGLKKREVPMKYYEYKGGTHVTPLQDAAERVFDFFDKHVRTNPAP